MDSIFSGINVIDLTQGIAGPLCGMQFAALGATVIKVEPLDGDYARHWSWSSDKESPVFLSLNRNKYSVKLDLTRREDIQTLKTLVAHADLLLEDLGESRADQLGVAYTSLVQICPRLIYVSFSAFGAKPEGMFKQIEGGSELVVQAIAGAWNYVGNPQDPPIRIGADVASTWAGMHAFQAIVAALIDRDRTGTGQKVEINLLRSLLSMYLIRHYSESLSVEPVHWLSRCEDPDSIWGIYPLWETADVPILIEFFASGFILDEPKWRAFFVEIGIPHIVQDERFSSVLNRRQHWKELRPILEGVFSRYTATQLREIVMRIGGVAMPANTIDLMVEDPQVIAMRIIGELTRPNQLPLSYIELPWEFENAQYTPMQLIQEITPTDAVRIILGH